MVEKDFVCEPYWFSNPYGLIASLSLRPDDICESTNINSFTRGMILLLLIGLALFPAIGWVSIAFSILIGLFLYGGWLFQPTLYQKTEGFEPAFVRQEEPVPAFPAVPISVPGLVATGPTAANPFMNVLLDEIKYNPSRPPAAPVNDPSLKIMLDDFFRVQWTSDPTDVFGNTQGQRQFYTMPSTSIPSDRESYQNWLYKIPGKTCKEGGRNLCSTGANVSAIPWLSQPN